MVDKYDPETGEVKGEDGNPSFPAIFSIEAARKLIMERHSSGLDADDPLLMMVTLHEGFMGDYEAMLTRHNQAITTVIGSAISGLTEKALSDHLENQVRLADRIEQEFIRQYTRARILSAINIVAGLICIPVLVFLFLK